MFPSASLALALNCSSSSTSPSAGQSAVTVGSERMRSVRLAGTLQAPSESCTCSVTLCVPGDSSLEENESRSLSFPSKLEFQKYATTSPSAS